MSSHVLQKSRPSTWFSSCRCRYWLSVCKKLKRNSIICFPINIVSPSIRERRIPRKIDSQNPFKRQNNMLNDYFLTRYLIRLSIKINNTNYIKIASNIFRGLSVPFVHSTWPPNRRKTSNTLTAPRYRSEWLLVIRTDINIYIYIYISYP